MSDPTIFFLGATGYLGSEFLLLLARDYPNYPISALVRNATPEKQARLREIHPSISVVEGNLDDAEIIVGQVLKADIIINVASSDHWPSVKATLEGLEKSSAARPGNPPLYIHVSGCGIISDNARGERNQNIKIWSDIGLDLKDCDQTNTHLESDIPIVEAGTRKENPVRTIIVYPGQIYGVGRGVQKSTLWLRIFLDFAKKVGYAGTWGPGHNIQNTIHVQDMADILFFIFKAALEGRAEEGAQGFYFGVTDTTLSYGEWAKLMGDHLFGKGLIKEPGCKPMPPEIVEPLGHYGWSLLGGSMVAKADRLAQMGWKPNQSLKVSLLETLPDSVDAAIDGWWVNQN